MTIPTPDFARILLVTFAASCLLAARPVAAAWEAVPELTLQAESDDNLRMSVADQDSSTRTALDARLRLRSFSERSSTFIEPRLVTDNYSNDADRSLENDDLFLTISNEFQGQKVDTEFLARYSEQSVMRSEFARAILDDLIGDLQDPDDGAGAVEGFTAERKRSIVRGNVDFTLSPRTAVRVRANYADVSYSGEAAALRSPYENVELGTFFVKRMSERNSLSVGALASEFTAARTNNSTDSVGVEVGFERRLSDAASLELSGGLVQSEYTLRDPAAPVSNDDEDTFTFAATLSKRVSDVTTWNLRIGRLVSPNSSGFLTVLDRLRADIRHDFTARLSGRLGVSILDRTPIGDLDASTERNYLRTTVQVEWAINPRWFIRTGLDYAHEERPEITDLTASSTMVFFGVSYRGLSRQ